MGEVEVGDLCSWRRRCCRGGSDCGCGGGGDVV